MAKKNRMTTQDRLRSMESDIVREISGGPGAEPIALEGPTRTYGVAGQTVEPGVGGTMNLTPNQTRTYGVAGQNVRPGPGGTMILTPDIQNQGGGGSSGGSGVGTVGAGGGGAGTNARNRESAFRILADEFKRYGFDDQEFFNQLEGLIKQDLSDAENRIEIRKLPAYERRFGAIKRRIDKGLSAINEATYLKLEDQYRNVMRQYGLPESYYKKPVGGASSTLDTLIEFDVSPVELEQRVSTAQNRLYNAPPEVMRLLSDYYGNVISNGDALAYILDPKNALSEIQRKVTAAEIGAGARQAGLTAGGISPLDREAQRMRAEELARYGVTGEQARQGFQTVAEVAPRGGQLAEFYKETPYTQQTAEAEVFGTAGAVEARRKRERLTALERSAFAGSAGAAQGALQRDRQGAF